MTWRVPIQQIVRQQHDPRLPRPNQGTAHRPVRKHTSQHGTIGRHLAQIHAPGYRRGQPAAGGWSCSRLPGPGPATPPAGPPVRRSPYPRSPRSTAPPPCRRDRIGAPVSGCDRTARTSVATRSASPSGSPLARPPQVTQRRLPAFGLPDQGQMLQQRMDQLAVPETVADRVAVGQRRDRGRHRPQLHPLGPAGRERHRARRLGRGGAGRQSGAAADPVRQCGDSLMRAMQPAEVSASASLWRSNPQRVARPGRERLSFRRAAPRKPRATRLYQQLSFRLTAASAIRRSATGPRRGSAPRTAGGYVPRSARSVAASRSRSSGLAAQLLARRP